MLKVGKLITYRDWGYLFHSNKIRFNTIKSESMYLGQKFRHLIKSGRMSPQMM